jgi:hypothetical protein
MTNPPPPEQEDQDKGAGVSVKAVWLDRSAEDATCPTNATKNINKNTVS